LAFQLVAPFVALWFITHDFGAKARTIATFAGFFPAMVFLGTIPIVTSLPGSLPRALILCFLVPLELLAQVLVFGGGVSGFFVEGFAVDYTAAVVAFVLLSAREGDNLRAVLIGLVVGGAGVAMFVTPLWSLYEGAHWAYWIALTATFATAVWTFVQLFAEHGSFAVRDRAPGPLTRWMHRTWPTKFPAPSLYSPDPVVVTAVIAGVVLWFAVPHIG
jgi:hypothetical protein